MNHEILFKAKRKSSRKNYQTWIYGYLFKDLDGTCQILFNSKNGDVEFEEVIPETISQFTGLLDKNGVKIFENDIVKYKTTYIKKKKQGIVLYDDKLMCSYEISKSLKEKDRKCADIFDTLDEKWECEVIGNIFDKESERNERM